MADGGAGDLGLLGRVLVAGGARLASFYVSEDAHGDVTLSWRESRVDQEALVELRDALNAAGLSAVVWNHGEVVVAEGWS